MKKDPNKRPLHPATNLDALKPSHKRRHEWSEIDNANTECKHFKAHWSVRSRSFCRAHETGLCLAIGKSSLKKCLNVDLQFCNHVLNHLHILEGFDQLFFEYLRHPFSCTVGFMPIQHSDSYVFCRFVFITKTC